MTQSSVRLWTLVAVSASLGILNAHFVWISPVSSKIMAGKPVQIQVGNGHEFPTSESPLTQDNLKVFAVSPSGVRTDIATAALGNFVTGKYAPKEPGMYRFAFVQDRGVLSQTPKGYLPGGKDKYPDAKRSFKSFRSAVAYAWTSEPNWMSESKSLGIPYEMTAAKSGDTIVLTVLKDGKPAPVSEISAVWPGQKEEKVGKTGAGGKFSYSIPAGRKGPMLLLANLVAPVTSSNYETDNYATALHLSW